MSEQFFSICRAAFAEPETYFTPELYVHVTSDEVLTRMYKITEKLVENAKKFNLTSILEPEEIVRKHIVDSVLPLAIMEKQGIVSKIARKTVADVGCGAGFPTLPMSAASLDYFPLFFMGIDSTAKKIGHIKESAEYADLTNIDATAARAEELTAYPDSPAPKKSALSSKKESAKKPKNQPKTEEKKPYFRERFDITTARAVAALPTLLELCAPLTKVGGYFCALKSHADEEILAAGNAHETLGLTLRDKISYTLPGGDARVVLIYEKTAETPRKYPRRYAEITKQPLK
ncbi:MAG: 16S rRNA (guanine(527)-N(7))-methyltransferase RsmG [Eubacteriales bacterium]|nr:16S rRNA (guanine(527)-N(7))-methyltransferase RsmG [Eubacteriales bacterium]